VAAAYPLFDLAFLRHVAWASLAVALVAALAGVVAFADPAFALCACGAALFDVALVVFSVGRAEHGLAAGHIDAVASLVMVAGRLLAIGVLLLVASLAGRPGVFWGTVVGALSFDITLATLGSAMAVRRSSRSAHEGR